MPQVFVKTPQANDIDYTINWDDGYLLTGETIASSSWSSYPSSTNFSITTGSFTTALATVDISGGLQGETYYARNLIITSGGRTDTRTLQFDIWGPR